MAAPRKTPRIPITLEVSYRTVGAFLVSYSTNLSKGGIFIETAQPLEIGETVSLKFDIPGAGLLDVDGTVAWIRRGSLDGLPDGMGVQFHHLDERHGDAIDDLVRKFEGLSVLMVAGSPDRLNLLGRYMRNIIACEVAEAISTEDVENGLADLPDLLLVDLDLAPWVGLRAIEITKQKSTREASSPPIILLAGDATVRERGQKAGADEALATPPSFHALQAAVIRTLSRPAAVSSRLLDGASRGK
jgi:uncharacterized protein (TIGR02266 family)